MKPPIGEVEPILYDLLDEIEAKTKIQANSDRHAKLRTILIHALDRAWVRGHDYHENKISERRKTDENEKLPPNAI